MKNKQPPDLVARVHKLEQQVAELAAAYLRLTEGIKKFNEYVKGLEAEAKGPPDAG